jgi:hypothetical protein
MGNERFIRCCVCDAIHHVSPFDKAPVYACLENDPSDAASIDDRPPRLLVEFCALAVMGSVGLLRPPQQGEGTTSGGRCITAIAGFK